MSIEARHVPVDYSANHDAALITVGVVFIVLSFLSLAARVYSKLVKRRPLQSDDFILIAAFILSVGETILILHGITSANLGRHTPPQLLARTLPSLQTLTFTTSLLQPTILYLSKLSILILLSRIFITRAFRLTLLLLLLLSTAWFLGTFLSSLLLCLLPPPLTPWSAPTLCAARTAPLDTASPPPWIATDLAILLAPLPLLRRLHLPRAQRAAVMALFLVGAAACAASCARFVTVLNRGGDETWRKGRVAVWDLVEAQTHVACAALLAAKPALGMCVPGRWRRGGRGRRRGRGRLWYGGRERGRLGEGEGERTAGALVTESTSGRGTGGEGERSREWVGRGADGGERRGFERLPSGLNEGVVRLEHIGVDTSRGKAFDGIGLAI